MHMADALINPAVAGIMWTASAGAAAFSIHSLRKENEPKKIPLTGIMGAFIFAAQMINFTIPGTGSSGHLCGGMLLSALLGPQAGFLTMIGVLLIQCLLFGDGGILALGCNIWNMAFYGCFIGALLFWRPVMRKSISKAKILFSSVAGSVFTLQLGAFSVVLQTSSSGITALPFSSFVAVMQPIHLAIGTVEGLITAAVLIFVYEARPELLYYSGESEKKAAKLSYKATACILLISAFMIGGGLSLAASQYPDGLEWSVSRITGSTELDAEGTVYDNADKLQSTTALLPDYSFKNSESSAATSFSGVIGSAAVIGICAGSAYAFKFFKRKSEKRNKK